jgi:hypothetical protein
MSRCYPYPPPGYEKKVQQSPHLALPTAKKEWHKHKDKKKKKKKKKEKAGDLNGEAHGEFAPDLAFFLGYIISSTTSIMYAINP